MMKKTVLLITILFSALTLSIYGEEWYQFRGPSGMGFTGEKISTQWSQDSIKWKVLIPGSGQSSIVEKEGKIFLTSADQDGSQRFLLCYEKSSGNLLWKRKVKYAGQESIHRMNSWATPTPVTSEDKVIAFFGPAGLHCFDLQGNPVWKLSLGDFPGYWGVSASPVIQNGILYQNCDSMGPSSLLAVDVESGKIKWKTPRVEKPRGGWSTPIAIDVSNKKQLVLNGEYGVRGYDLDTGKELWFCKGFNGRGSPIPYYDNQMLVVVNGKPGDLYAVDPSGSGDVSKSHLRWNARRNGGRDLPSPAMVKNYIFVTSMSGVITCYEAKTGKTLWIERLNGAFSGSPLVSKSHYYIQNENGSTFVIKPDPKKLIIESINQLTDNDDEIFRSTLSPIDNFIFARSNRYLYCVKGN